MANNTRSGQKIKDDGNCISKGRHTYGNGVTSLSTVIPDTSGLRRSQRVTYSSTKNMTLESSSSKQKLTFEAPASKKNVTQSSPSIRKSERLEKGTSTTPVQRKSVGVENQTELSRLRRSERGKKLSSPSSLGSKKCDKSLSSPEMKQKKVKKEKSVKQLNMETKELSSESENQDKERVQVRKRKRNAHSYRALLKRNKEVKAKDHDKEMNGMDESSQGYSSHCEDGRSKKINKDRGISSDAEQTQLDSSMEENLQSPELLEHAVESGMLDDDIALKRGQNLMPLKRKRNEVDKVSAASSAVVASKETSVSHAATPSSPTRCPEICGNKKQRVDSDSTEQEIVSSCLPTSKEKMDRDLCDPSIAEDRGELQVGMTTGLASKNQMQQNGFNVDIPACPDENTCFICKRGQYLLCCNEKDCKRSYHISCIVPPLKDVLLGAWHCPQCVKKKIVLGALSLSGVESIWDAKEVELLDGDGFIRQKEYFVKYKGLAHVHNHWVPERQLLSEVPSLVAKLNRKPQAMKWKQEWTLPHRLLQRRRLTSTKQHDEHIIEHAAEDSDCHYEWLVKWHGLGYEHATWELENASFINSSKGKSLIKDYEDRLKRAKQASSISIDKEKKLKSGFPVKFPHLPAGGSSGFDKNLECANKLREHWHNRQNAIVFDEQDRIVKAVLFISSLLSDVTRPFLILSASTVLHLWEDEISHTSPSADVVIYNGNIETRKIIRTSEFYEGGCMFQALITSPEVLIEDLDVFDCIAWEVIIIDECQLPIITSYFEQIRMLSTEMRLLLVSGLLKDITEYRNMLSVLEADGGLHRSDALMVDANDNIGSLKERLSKYVAYPGKLDCSSFVEYWVPVQISDAQLEQYCATLLSNSLSLRSTSKYDPVGAFHDMLISIRKCCDHPFLVDKSLQSLLVKDLASCTKRDLAPAEVLDVGIKACGKLQLLDIMLSELKKQGSRVLVIFQSIGGGSEMGDILDDFVRQRYGSHSFERVDVNVVNSKKKYASALHNFNNGSEMFVFLLETRACRWSIKLSSIHTVVIFHSDWSPQNDLRALQKLTFESQLEQIKVFRLYSSFTVEEKVLILAKQDKTPDGYMQNIRPSNSQVLLMWGASYLFNRLDQFHSGNVTASSSSNLFEESLQKVVVQEFLTILAQTGEDNNPSKYNVILKVEQNQGTYRATSPLFGESRVEGMDEESPFIFWTKLLEGKNPCWKYYSNSSEGSRKRVQYLQKKLEAENNGVVKKLGKVADVCVNRSHPKPGTEEGKIVSWVKEGTSVHSYSQKDLHLSLKPEIAKLCEVLHLREDVKDTVDKFLEYVMINHHVNREPETLLQAFEISVCWTSASWRGQKIGRKMSLALAKQHMNFRCKKREALFVFSLLQCLKEVFELSMKYASKHHSNAGLSQSETTDKVDDRSAGQLCSGKRDYFKVAQKDFSRSVRVIKKECQKQMKKLNQKHLEEKEDVNKRYEEEKAVLDRKKRTEAAVIRCCRCTMQKDRLKKLDINYAKQLEELKHKIEAQLENLEEVHVAAMNKVRERESSWVESVKSWLQSELSNKPSSSEFGYSVDCLQGVEKLNAYDNQGNDVPSFNISEGQNSGKHVNVTLVSREGAVNSSVIQGTIPVEVVACSNPLETAGPLRLDTEGDELDTIASEGTSIAGSLDNNQENNASLNPCSREQILDGDMLSMPDRHIQLAVSSDGAEDCLPPVHSSDEHIHDGAKLSPEGQFPGEAIKMVGSNDGLEDVVPLNASSKDQVPDGATTSMPDREVLLGVSEADSLSNTENFTFSPTSELIDTGALLAVPDEGVPFRVSENIHPSDGLENTVSLNSSSTGQIPDVSMSCIPSADRLGVPENCPGEIENGNITGDNYEAHGTSSENVNNNLHLHERSLVNPPSVRTQTIIEDFPVPSNQVLQDVCCEPMPSTGVQDRDAAATEMEIALQVEPLPDPVDAVASDESNHAAAASEPPSGEVRDRSSSENCFANQMVENRVQLSNQAPLEHVTSSPLNPPTDASADRMGANSIYARTGIVISGHGNCAVQSAAPPVASRFPQHADPLQNELDMLRKSAVEASRICDETKLKLKSDCDREVEEAITQIRRKYEIKLQEVDTEFLLRKLELDSNANKVMLNNIVALAFRSKWMDTISSSLGTQEGPSGPPAVSLQTTAPPAASLPITPPAASPHTAVPASQAVPQSVALFSSIPSRPPHISSGVSPVNYQVGRGFRAPAPHLQPYRPLTSLPSTSLSSSVLPILPINPRPTSLQLPQQRPPMATYSSGLHIRASMPDASRLVPLYPNHSQPVMDLPVNSVDNRSRGIQIPPCSLPELSDFGSTVPINKPESTIPNGKLSNPTPVSEPAGVVCLSDDD